MGNLIIRKIYLGSPLFVVCSLLLFSTEYCDAFTQTTNACTKCSGKGTTPCRTCKETGSISANQTCGSCAGTGIRENTCSACSGSGYQRDIRQCTKCNGNGKVKGTLWGYNPCDSCNATGNIDVGTKPCLPCNGAGKKPTRCPQCGGVGRYDQKQSCPKCDGYRQLTCTACQGKGKVIVTKRSLVDILRGK